jgi:hypothetical protein
MEIADMVGYMENRAGKRTIDFNPTERHIGKNTAEFSLTEVPHYTAQEYGQFMGALMQKTKTKMSELSDQQKEVLQKVGQYRDSISQSEDPDELLLMLQVIRELEVVVRTQIEKLWNDRYKAVVLDLVGSVADYADANRVLELVQKSPLPIQKTLKQSLWKQAKEKNIQFDKDTKSFIEWEEVSAEQEFSRGQKQEPAA